MTKPFAHEKLKKAILQKVKNGELKPGARILSIGELGKKYGISAKSVIKAIEELKAENILSTHQGKGTFIASAEKSAGPSNKTIGVITPDLLISFHTEIVVAIEKEAFKKGYQVVIGNTDNMVQKEEHYMKEFFRQGLDGAVVVAGKNSINNKYFSGFVTKTPVVLVDIAIEGIRTDLVTTDDVSGAYEAICHLINLGHRKIALITGPLDVSTARQRMKGCKKAFLEYAIPFNQNLIRTTDYNERSGYQAMLELLNVKDRPTAVFAASDVEALGVIKAIHSRNLRVPEDISVVGYGNLKLVTEIPLTSVLQPAYEMGTIAFRNLLEKIEGTRSMADIKEVIFPTKLIVRESSGPCNPDNKTSRTKEAALVYQNR